MPTRFAVYLPVFSDRDAVGRDAAGIAKALNAQGIPARVVADHRAASEYQAYPADEYLKDFNRPGDVLLYHHCTYSPHMGRIVVAGQTRALRFHDVTPGLFFEGYSASHEAASRAAEEQTYELVASGQFALYLPTSQLTRDVLIRAGAPAAQCHVLPPFHRADALVAAASAGKHSPSFAHDGRINLLTVGRLSPNKNHLHLIRTLAELHTRSPGRYRLIVVGPVVEGLESWHQHIRQTAASLGVADSLVLTGSLPEESLAAQYRAARAFVIASLHEGFCVPLVEAMALGVPIIGLSRTATPETAGSAARLIDSETPANLADAIEEVCLSQRHRADLIAQGHQRYLTHFSSAAIEDQLANAMRQIQVDSSPSVAGWWRPDELTEDNAVDQAMQHIEAIGDYPDRFHGRGIVICAGGLRYNTCAYVVIRMLRTLGCRLPIQVWCAGDEERDEGWIKLVEPFGVKCVDGYQVPGAKPGKLDGWPLKPFSILHCPFEEVLLIDADNVPVQDPTYLFDDARYRDVGAVFWPDGTRTPQASPRWKLFGVSYRDEPEQESGQILINKRKCWRCIQLCNWYNEHSWFFYQYVYGDKDTFRFAWHRLGQRFLMPSKPIEFLSRTLCQHDLDGHRIFQHRAHGKWSLGINRRVKGFVHEDLCLGFVDELRRQWRPWNHLARNVGPADEQAMRTLEDRTFDQVRVGHSRWPLRLGPGGLIAEGASGDLLYWWVQDQHLVLATSFGKEFCRLEQHGDGVWRGHAHVPGRFEVRLIPSAATGE